MGSPRSRGPGANQTNPPGTTLAHHTQGEDTPAGLVSDDHLALIGKGPQPRRAGDARLRRDPPVPDVRGDDAVVTVHRLAAVMHRPENGELRAWAHRLGLPADAQRDAVAPVEASLHVPVRIQGGCSHDMHRQSGSGRGGGRSAQKHAQQADEAHQEEGDPAHWSTSGALCAGVVSSLKVLFPALTWLVSSWWSSTSDSSFWPDWPSWTSPSSETPSSPEPPSRLCEPLLV